ncbi:multicopper oxidase domain-containing protein [Mycolicibacterium sp. S2-37]|uniref:multicopper oxidase family protein n=1 Tax=Mycolicibacterium sp. S2-37 TaxID=2810297 RepID=UPI001A9418EF|nr:multicopper oxidase domain-containing protein [Mycolicibacterium sp. S2-37]MBO0681341.1 multicopper oxidase domain-containing protein [Mycolicibacterium sp. S2-37]
MYRRRSKPTAALAYLVVAAMVMAMTSCASHEPAPQIGVNAGPDGTPAAYREPVKLSSEDGVLEVRLSAHQGTVDLDTVKEPVSNFMVFGYELVRGTSSDGSTKGDNTYPAPTLRVDPGERLIVHYDNDLADMTIQDYYDPAYTRAGADVPLYPEQLESSPLNLHTHGLHVSPDGNADNVLLDIPAGMGNTFDYAVPDDMPQGLYWYHSHRHTLTAQQTYRGLAGMLEIGRPDGNLPLVTQNDIPVRTMALQYNYVFDRANGGHQLNDLTRPQWVNTAVAPTGSQMADGTYAPSLAPVNFAERPEGTRYMTNWYQGPLSPRNHRGQNQFVPGNLQSFTSREVQVPADPQLAENLRDVQYTVNGQFQPELIAKPGQTEIWVLGNFSDIAYMSVGLRETATGNRPPFAVVGQDGNPFLQVQRPVDGDGTRLLIPPGSRYAIAVTMPETGDLVLELPRQQNVPPVVNPGVLYTGNGTANPPAVLGTVTVDTDHISYTDGFFTFPVQTLLTVKPGEGAGRTTAFEPGQNLGAYTSFVDTSAMTPDLTRELVVRGGFDNQYANKTDPKSIMYQFADNAFPNIPLIQARLNSVEEWKVVNYNNDAHPMHIHVNDFQVTEIVNPIAGTRTGVQMWGEDNVNVPAPVIDDNEVALDVASTTVRTQFTGYTGTFVIHCHRLNHEDNGLMATVSVIPEVSTYAVAIPGSDGRPAAVRIYDADGDRMIADVRPFNGFQGTPSVAMADVNGDMVLDLIAGTGEGVAPEVVAYSGAEAPSGRFRDQIARFAPFDADFRGGVRVAGADIDGNALSSNIIVGSGPGKESQVRIFSTTLPDRLGEAPEVFSSFSPYPGSRTGVTLAAGMVDMASGRESIVTAPGPGDAPLVKTFRYDLYTPTARMAARATTSHEHSGYPGAAEMTSQFLAFDDSYRDGVALSTGWVAGEEGGAKSIITGQAGGPGTVRVWSSGSRLDGFPAMYTLSPDHHDAAVTFEQTASFDPFPGAGGVAVATTSTTTGADLLVSGAGELRKYSLGRPAPESTTLAPTQRAAMTGRPGVTPLGGR